MIDMDVPSERNVAKKVVGKLTKYKDLEIEIQRMWNLKTIMVPVVIGALGLIKRGMTKMSTKFQKTLKLKNFRKQYCSELHISSTKQFQLPELQPCVKP